MPKVSLEFYIRDESRFTARLDPRTKLLYVMWIFFMIMIFSHPFYQALTFSTVIVLALLGGCSLKTLFQSSQFGMYVGLTSCILWILFLQDTGQPLLHIPLGPLGILSPTDKGVLYGMGVAFRVFTLLFAFVMISMTTSARSIIVGLYRLRLPFVFSFVIGIILRMIPQLLAEHATIIEAQKSRACEFDKGHIFSRLRKHTSYIIPLALRTLKIISDMSLAMESRAFDPYATRTFVSEPQYTQVDYVFIGVMGLILVTALVMRLNGYGGVIAGLL